MQRLIRRTRPADLWTPIGFYRALSPEGPRSPSRAWGRGRSGPLFVHRPDAPLHLPGGRMADGGSHAGGMPDL
jgi:hypothetical protein